MGFFTSKKSKCMDQNDTISDDSSKGMSHNDESRGTN